MIAYYNFVKDMLCGPNVETVITVMSVLWLTMFALALRSFYLFAKLSSDTLKAQRGWRTLFPMFLFSANHLSEVGLDRRAKLFKSAKFLCLLAVIYVFLILTYIDICPRPLA